MDILNNRKCRKQILLTEEDRDKLKAVSKGTGLSENEIINRGLTSYLKRYKQFYPEGIN